MMVPGFAFDITCVDPGDGMPWDFGLEANREKAGQMLDRVSDVPRMVVMTTPQQRREAGE